MNSVSSDVRLGSSRSRQRTRNRCLSFLALIAAAQVGRAVAGPDTAEPFYLFRDGRPMAAIVVDRAALTPPKNRLCDHIMEQIPEDVPTDVARAVALFQSDVQAGYGVDLPVVAIGGTTLPADAKPLDEPLASAAAQSGLPNRIELVVEDRSLLTEDATWVAFPSANVMRITGGEAGVVRTLFHLLEKFGGARYLFQSTGSKIGIGAHFPQRNSLAIPRESFTHSSAFPLHRQTGQTTYGADWPGDRNRIHWWSWEARLGTKSRVANSHYLTKVAFPIDRYMRSEDKPDEDMFPILRGERVRPWEWGADLDAGYVLRGYRSGWQPRYSSPAAVDEAAMNLLAYLRENPGVRSLTLSVNDNGGHCETETDPEHPPRENPKLVAAYYGWVNAVAERVAAEFPDVVFGAIAYREVQPPPDFKLHPNVVVFITFDLQACADKEVRARREQLILDWSKIARVGVYSYDYGDQFFTLPRLYFREMQQMIRYLHEQGAVAAISERPYNTFTEGPKQYLLYKLWEDPHLDLEATLRDWCEAAVGSEAAPVLREYYAFWEAFWREKAIHTTWWNSRTAIYLSLGKFGSSMYALEPGDMAHCRTLMERVVALAGAQGADDQQRRARLLMAGFEWYEACAAASGAEFFAPTGILPDAATAAAMLRAVPDAVKAYQTVRTLPHETDGWAVPKATADWGMQSPVPAMLSAATAWISDPEACAELKTLSNDPALDPQLRFLASAIHQSAVGDGMVSNVLENGGFEQEEGAIGSSASPNYLLRGRAGWETWSPVHGNVSRSDELALHGSHSLKCEIAHNNFRAIRLVPEVRKDKQHYFSAWVYVPKDQPVSEGRLRIMGSPASRQQDGTLRSHGLTANIPNVVLNAGQWNYVGCVIPEGGDSLLLRIDLRNFERGDVAYIDDIQVYAIPKSGDE